MWLLLIAGLQSQSQALRSDLSTGKVDLSSVIDTDRCPTSTGDEIVVCAANSATERQRLRPLPAIAPEALLPQAKVDLGHGVSGAIQGSTATFPGGITSNRAMVTIKVPF